MTGCESRHLVTVTSTSGMTSHLLVKWSTSGPWSSKSDVTPGDWTPGDRYIKVRVNLGRGQEVEGQ